MDLYKEKHAELTSMGVDGTVNGRNNLDKSVSASPSSQLATVGSGTVGGGEGGLWVGANGGGNGGRFPPTPMQDGKFLFTFVRAIRMTMCFVTYRVGRRSGRLLRRGNRAHSCAARGGCRGGAHHGRCTRRRGRLVRGEGGSSRRRRDGEREKRFEWCRWFVVFIGFSVGFSAVVVVVFELHEGYRSQLQGSLLLLQRQGWQG